MCYEYDRTIPDCGMHLLQLYMEYGVYESAITLVENIIRANKGAKLGVHHYKTWDCDLPRVVLDVYSLRLSREADFPLDKIKYMLLLVSWTILLMTHQ